MSTYHIVYDYITIVYTREQKQFCITIYYYKYLYVLESRSSEKKN